ncbi:MAG: VCBS repeat-containing protein [Treponema sp.]|nr:VCBS repeat-containing protein [Treponema sp.]
MIKFTKRAVDLENKCEACSVFDVDNNGIPDIVCGEFWYEGPDFTRKHRICHLKYDGGYVYDFSDCPMDVDGDGWTDIITGNWWDDGLFWRQNPGKAGGEWTTHKIMSLTNIETIHYYDIDGDGQVEIVPNCPGEPAFFVKLIRDKDGKGTGKFEKYVIGGEKANHGLGAGDIDGDGLPEFILNNGILHMKNRDPYGPWDFSEEYRMHWSTGVPILVYDVNGDGKNDLIAGVGHGYGLYWYEQGVGEKGERTWTAHCIDGAWSQYHALRLADIDGDGKPELVTGKRYKAHNGNDPGDDGDVFVCYYKMRDGGFYRYVIDCGDPADGHSGVGICFWIADITGNGKPDIIAPGKEGLYSFTQD